jgi:hypothetical protein
MPRLIKLDPQTFNTEACVQLVGQVVKCAIQDATNKGTGHSSTISLARTSAKRFLFDPGILEEFFKKYHLDEKVNCAMIRFEAREIMAGRKKLRETPEPTDQTETEC